MTQNIIAYTLPKNLQQNLFQEPAGASQYAEVVAYQKGALTLNLNDGVVVTTKDVKIVDKSAVKMIGPTSKLIFDNDGEVIGVVAPIVEQVKAKPQVRASSGSNAPLKNTRTLY
jgi:hypothetical protein